MSAPLKVLAEKKISGWQKFVPAGIVADFYILEYIFDPVNERPGEYFALVTINEPSRGGVAHHTILNAPLRADDSVDPKTHLDDVLRKIFETGELRILKTGKPYVLVADSTVAD